jgi:hypothetical protein
MNQRDITRIAKHMGKVTLGEAYHAQTKATVWCLCVDALADGLAECNPGFDRKAFVQECRGAAADIPRAQAQAILAGE